MAAFSVLSFVVVVDLISSGNTGFPVKDFPRLSFGIGLMSMFILHVNPSPDADVLVLKEYECLFFS